MLEPQLHHPENSERVPGRECQDQGEKYQGLNRG